MDEHFPHGGDRKSSCVDGNLKDEGINEHESSDARLVNNESEIAQKETIVICMVLQITMENNLQRNEIYGEKMVQGLAQSIGTSKRTLNYAITV